MAKIVQRFQCSRQGSGHVSQCCSYSYIYMYIYAYLYIHIYVFKEYFFTYIKKFEYEKDN